MLLKTGNQYVGVVRIAPEMIRIVIFSWTSTLLTWALFNQTGEHYSAVEYTRLKADVLRVAIIPR